MRTIPETEELIKRAVATITSNTSIEGFIVTVYESDEYDAPFLEIGDTENGEKVLRGIGFPKRLADKLSDDGIRAGTAIELVNWYLQELTPPELEMVSALKENVLKFPGPENTKKRLANANEIRRTFETDYGVNDLDLARKLKGDKEIPAWLTRADFKPEGMIEFFQVLIDETPERIRPESRIQPRVFGLQTRIHHIKLILNGQDVEAKKIRSNQDSLVQEILKDKAPSTV